MELNGIKSTSNVRTYVRRLIIFRYITCSISMGNLITESSAAIWRGLMVMSALQKLLYNVDWAPLDYMIIDTPPGTGDTLLTLVQNVPLSGCMIIP